MILYLFSTWKEHPVTEIVKVEQEHNRAPFTILDVEILAPYDPGRRPVKIFKAETRAEAMAYINKINL